jgi:hypothetical protein
LTTIVGIAYNRDKYTESLDESRGVIPQTDEGTSSTFFVVAKNVTT